jgi:hypothetical protein
MKSHPLHSAPWLQHLCIRAGIYPRARVGLVFQTVVSQSQSIMLRVDVPPDSRRRGNGEWTIAVESTTRFVKVVWVSQVLYQSA